MTSITRFVVVEYDNLMGTGKKVSGVFDSRLAAFDHMCELIGQWRPCDIRANDQYGHVIGSCIPNPYDPADRYAVRLWEDKNPAWRDHKGMFTPCD